MDEFLEHHYYFEWASFSFSTLTNGELVVVQYGEFLEYDELSAELDIVSSRRICMNPDTVHAVLAELEA